MDWSGRAAVVTGAASGIGRALVQYAAGLGMHVLAADVDRDGLAATRDGASGLPGAVEVEETDVRSGEAVEALAARAWEAHGAVALFFNNAGVLVDGKTWERSEADWRWQLEVNVLGVVHGIRAAVPRMLAQAAPGRIVNTASIGGLLGGGAFMGPYQASKHAVVAISESLYGELALEAAEVDASVLCPGEVATGIFRSDRLRPEPERTVYASDAERQFHDMVSGTVDMGLAPEELARRAFDGIEAGRFWLLPQPAFKPLFEQRTRSVLDESQPVTMAEMIESGAWEGEAER